MRDRTQASRYFHGWSAVHQRLFALDLDEVDDVVVGRSPDTTSQPELVDLVDAAVTTFQEMADLVDVDYFPWALALATRVDRRRCVADQARPRSDLPLADARSSAPTTTVWTCRRQVQACRQ